MSSGKNTFEDIFLKTSNDLVKDTYIIQGLNALNSRHSSLKTLLASRKIPERGLDDFSIELILSEISVLDSNNFPSTCGLGEREGRVFSNLVKRRNYYFSHGIGRSGDIQEEQPKAAGSSIINKLTSYLALDALHTLSLTSMKKCLVFPLATGMCLSLCMLTLKKDKPEAKYVIWSRIDQKSCFKSILTAGLIPIIVDVIPHEDALVTDIEKIKDIIADKGESNILCIFTTTSCFAPRSPDRVDEVAKICKASSIFHIINNAYGLQCKKISKLINRAVILGRVDYVISSTDKNFMVPVGGGIIASPDISMVSKVGKFYPGRASIGPILDLFITLLSMGKVQLLNLVLERERLVETLNFNLQKFLTLSGEKILQSPLNTISTAVSINSISHTKISTSQYEPNDNKVTFFGSMLFQRGVSGTRVIQRGVTQSIAGFTFHGWGSSTSNYPHDYFTAACSIGLNEDEILSFIERLNKCYLIFQKKYLAP